MARYAKRVAPHANILLGRCAGPANLFQHLGQFEYAARQIRCSGMGAKTIKTPLCSERRKNSIYQLHHPLRITARMVAAQDVATEFLSDKTLGVLKHLGLGATEAVNALLGVTNDKNRRRARRAGITGYPGLQSFPLQWVGVLKLIDQQMPHLRIEPLANPCAAARVGEQAQGRQLEIIHIQPGTLTL